MQEIHRSTNLGSSLAKDRPPNMNNAQSNTPEGDLNHKSKVEFLNGSSNEASTDTGPSLDGEIKQFMESINDEIEKEVRLKRSQGAYPPAFERRLKSIFEQLVPPGAGNARRDFEALLRSSDRAAYFDIDVPTTSQKPGVSKVKKILRATQAWYLNYLTQQLNNFTTNLMRLLYVFDARLVKLENTFEAGLRSGPEGKFIQAFYPDAQLDQKVINEFAKSPGRTLVTDCGNGQLVKQLCDQGIDAYGVDGFGNDLDNPIVPDLDLRWQRMAEHLKEIDDQALSGLVLQGSIDLMPATDKLQIALEARRLLLDNALLLIIGCNTQFYETSPNLIVQRDLATGRPFAPQTWESVFQRIGVDHIMTLPYKTHYIVVGRVDRSRDKNKITAKL